MKGCWLTDAHSTDYAWLMNTNGDKGCIWFEDGFTYESVKVRLEYKLCSHYNGLSGLPCDSWLYLEPGDYYIWVHTALGKSNKLKFKVLDPKVENNGRSVITEKSIVTGTSTDRNDPYLNVRSGPGIDFPIFKKITDGTVVVVIAKNLGNDYNWAKIQLGTDEGSIGYVNLRYLKPY